MLTSFHIPVISFLVGAYLSTWSAALLQTIVFPAIGTGPEKISASHRPAQEQPRICFAQRRHTPLVKHLSIGLPPPSNADYPRSIAWCAGAMPPVDFSLPVAPTIASHSGRAPPSC